jgi:hypothetical protein
MRRYIKYNEKLISKIFVAPSVFQYMTQMSRATHGNILELFKRKFVSKFSARCSALGAHSYGSYFQLVINVYSFDLRKFQNLMLFLRRTYQVSWEKLFCWDFLSSRRQANFVFTVLGPVESEHKAQWSPNIRPVEQQSATPRFDITKYTIDIAHNPSFEGTKS